MREAGIAAAVVLAAGSGRRMGSHTAKQFLPLCGKPVLYWTLAAFEESGADAVILVVSNEAAADHCQVEIIEKYGFRKVRAITFGGEERQDSVWRGLACLRGLQDGGSSDIRASEGILDGRFAEEGCSEGMPCFDFVAIHDGARCLVTPEIIDRTFADARKYKAAACAMPVKDTIRLADEEGFTKETPDRRKLYLMQTPQTFSFPLIYDAYEAFAGEKEKAGSAGYDAVTDDAEVLWRMAGRRTYLSEGSYENLKITTPEDLLLAEAILRSHQ